MMRVTRLLWWCFLAEALLNLVVALVAVLAPPLLFAQFSSQAATPVALFFVQSWGVCLVGLAVMEGGVVLRRKDDTLLAGVVILLFIGDLLYGGVAAIFGEAQHQWPGALVGSLVVTGVLVVLRLIWLFSSERPKTLAATQVGKERTEHV